jgi:hypothetical protein
MSKTKYSEVIEKAIDNIEKDRDMAHTAASDIIAKIAQASAAGLAGDGSLRDQAVSLSKHIEALQRSNEQLIKIANLLKKEGGAEDGGVDLDDEEVVFDLIEQSRGDNE